MADFYASYPVGGGSGGGGGGVTSLNGLTGILDITSSTLNIAPSGGSIAIDAQGNSNTFASFDNSGNLESAPGWNLDQLGQAFVQTAGTQPTDQYTSLQISPTLSSSLSGGYEGVIVGGNFSSSMSYQSSYNVENTYTSTYVMTGGIGQFQDQSNFNAGATGDGYSSFVAFPIIAGNTDYTGLDLGATLSGTTPGDTAISIGINLNSGYNNTGGFLAINDSNNLNTGATVQNYVSYNADPVFNGVVQTQYQGVNISPQGSTAPVTGMTAFDADFSHFPNTSYLPQALNINQGNINQNCTLDTQFITPDATYGINQVGGTLKVSAGFPITGGQFGFGNNIGVGLEADDNINIDSSGIDLGFSSVGFVTDLSVATGKTVATLNMMVAGAGIASPSAGSITNASLFRALGFLPEGGTLNITNLFGFKADPILSAIGAINTWGFYDGSGTDNYFTKIALGTVSQKVTNSSVALELGGTTRAVVFTNVTTVQKLLLTALPGMQVFDTTLNQMSYYNGATWINF